MKRSNQLSYGLDSQSVIIFQTLSFCNLLQKAAGMKDALANFRPYGMKDALANFRPCGMKDALAKIKKTYSTIATKGFLSYNSLVEIN